MDETRDHPDAPALSAFRAADHLIEVVRLADLEAGRRLNRAEREATALLTEAREQAAELVAHARVDADAIRQSAHEQARRKLAEARLAASEVLRQATTEVHETFGTPSERAVGGAPQVARLLRENGQLADRMRTLNLELAEHLFPRHAETAPTPTIGQPPAHRNGARMSRSHRREDEQSAVRGRRGAWGRLVHRRRRVVLGIGALIAVACTIWGPAVVALLSGGGFDVAGSESARTVTAIDSSVGPQSTDLVALYRSKDLTVSSAAYKSAVARVVSALPSGEVVSSSTFWTTGSDAFVSTDRHATYLALQLSSSIGDDAVNALRRQLVLDPAVGSTTIGGATAVDLDISDQVSSDLTRAELISAPVLTVLLVLVFGSLVSAGLPLLIGGLTVVASFAVLRLLTQLTDVSIFAVNIITVLGLGLSIDYALLIVSRFREELRAGHETSEALARTLTTAGRSVAVSATTVAAALAGLLFFPVVFLRSMAFGGVAAVLVAAIASLSVLPAILAMVGKRIDALAVPRPRLPGRWRRSRPGAPAAGGWDRLARSVMRRPVLYTLAISVLLVTMALPTLGVKFGGIDARQLPVDSPSRVVADQLARDFTDVQLDPRDVLVTGGGGQAMSSTIAATAGVSSVRTVASRGEATLLEVTYPGEAVDAGARSLVARLRTLPAPAGSTVLVGGYSAEQVDLRAAVAAGLWKMGLLTLLATFLVLFWAFGSVVLPIKAVFMNALTVGASLGVVVLIFQDGYLSRALHFSSTGSVELTQPILVLAILFGISTDYEVFLLSRIREHWDRTGDNTAAVATGLQRTGPIITSAAALILVVIVAFSTSQIVFIKLIGVGMAVAILLDATVVRALLVPATMRLLGGWNWWSPGPLLRFWERHRPPSESLDEHEHLEERERLDGRERLDVPGRRDGQDGYERLDGHERLVRR